MSDVLATLSNELAAVVENTGRSVVRVEARRRLPASGVVWSNDGLIVTAHHVVHWDENIRVGVGAETFPAALVGRDPSTDLAVLRAEGIRLPAAAWETPDDLRVGHLALALGRPGRSVQATFGIVSALGEGWRSPAGGLIDRYLQTDVVMYPGFSGGPLVDALGVVRGVNSSALMRGVSLAVPTSTVSRVVEALLEHGRIRRGYLGVGAQPARLPEAIAEELGQETGLLLVSVEKGSPAERGGLVMGDTIVGLGGERVRHLDDLMALLGGDSVGQERAVRVLRGGGLAEVTVVIGERE
jgi:S1-C subfamily serine protease